MLSPQRLLQTRMDPLAKDSLAMCIIPLLADTPTSYVFSELLLVYMTVCACCDWLGKRSKRSRHFFNQSEVKPKPMVICWHVFSGAWCQVPEFSLGTLRSNDADDNKNVKKTIGLISTTTTSHVHHTVLYISFPFLHDYDVKMPHFAFYGGRKQATTKFFFSFWAWIWSLEIQLH